MEQRAYGLPQEALKLIACITMLIDHIGVVIVPQLHIPWMAQWYYACRIIGRFALPIYCFLLAEGMHHTRNPGKYILRLAIGILLAELPYDLLFEKGFTWEEQSIMTTLTLGAIMLLCMQKLEAKWLKLLVVLPFALLAEQANCEYGQWGIAMIAVFALIHELPFQMMGVLLVNAQIPSGVVTIFGRQLPIQFFALLAMALIAVYSGEKLTRSRAVQWGFYLFYPVHLILLGMILRFIR